MYDIKDYRASKMIWLAYHYWSDEDDMSVILRIMSESMTKYGFKRD